MTTRPDGIIQPFKERHRDFLKDESRTAGTAESISFPGCEAEVRSVVRLLSKQQMPITVQGNRTGLYGGAVPAGGHVMNLSQMNKVLGLECDPNERFAIRVQPGVSLAELDRQLESRGFESDAWDRTSLRALEILRQNRRQFWPPDPSENSASIGGVAANNSRGICGHHYGPVCDHIKNIRVVDGRGEIWPIPRGQYVYSPKERLFPVPGGAKIPVTLTNFQSGSIHCLPLDLMDVYLGSEGTLGVITELTLILQPFPSQVLGIVFFFQESSRAIEFIEVVGQKQNPATNTRLAAVEFMDHATLECIRRYRQTNPRMREIPGWHTRFLSAVCLEIHGDSGPDTDALAEWLMTAAVKHGSDPDASWAFSGVTEIERMRRFRHAAPESVIQMIDQARLNDPRIAWLGVDLCFRCKFLPHMLEMCADDLQALGLEAAIFGHAADGHLYLCMLPQNGRQFDEGKALIESWAKKAGTMDVRLVSEHGVGKTRNYLLRAAPLPERIELIQRLKRQLDPTGLMNPGNMLC